MATYTHASIPASGERIEFADGVFRVPANPIIPFIEGDGTGPDIWRAAVAWVGVSDLHKLYAKSMEHFKYYFREQMGDPEKDRALWRDRSAVEFADQRMQHALTQARRNMSPTYRLDGQEALVVLAELDPVSAW